MTDHDIRVRSAEGVMSTMFARDGAQDQTDGDVDALTQRRRQVTSGSRRWSVNLSVYVNIDGTWHYCTVYDISPGGARIRPVATVHLTVGDTLIF